MEAIQSGSPAQHAGVFGSNAAAADGGLGHKPFVTSLVEGQKNEKYTMNEYVCQYRMSC